VNVPLEVNNSDWLTAARSVATVPSALMMATVLSTTVLEAGSGTMRDILASRGGRSGSDGPVRVDD